MTGKSRRQGTLKIKDLFRRQVSPKLPIQKAVLDQGFIEISGISLPVNSNIRHGQQIW